MKIRYGLLFAMVAGAGLLASCQDAPTSAAKVGGDDSTVTGMCGDDWTGLPEPPSEKAKPAWKGDAWVAVYLRTGDGSHVKYDIFTGADGLTRVDRTGTAANQWTIYQFSGGVSALTVVDRTTGRKWSRSFTPDTSCITSHLVIDMR